MKLVWANFFHIYQPPDWDPKVTRKVARESYEPLFAFLLEHPEIRITLNITGSLIEQFIELRFSGLLKTLSALFGRGQVELTTTPAFHPFSPLLPFSHVKRQMEYQRSLLHEIFGDALAAPAGFYSPEMAVSPEFLADIAGEGFAWTITDDFLLPQGTLPHPERGFLLNKTNLRLLFRSHVVSDYLGFFADPGEDEAHFRDVLEKQTQQSAMILTAMDGENLGHHRPETLPMWTALVQSKGIECVTVSEYLERQYATKEIVPQAGSWSTEPEDLAREIPFPLWKDPENPIHALQWRLTNTVVDALERLKDEQIETDEIDRALVSDQYWWASTKPWWDRDIIIRLADRLAAAAERLPLIEAERELVQETVAEIRTTANDWQEKGIAEERRRTFLAKAGGVRYFGGERIDSSGLSTNP